MRRSGILTTIAIFLGLIFGAARAQEPIGVEGVEPNDGEPGQHLDIIIWGGGFTAPQAIDVTIGDLDILDIIIEADDRLRVPVFIPPDAPPGPRPVEVIGIFGENEFFGNGLEEGFFVLEGGAVPPEEGPPPTLPPTTDGVPPWLWWGGILLIVIGLAWRLRPSRTPALAPYVPGGWQQAARLQWQLQATTQLPPPQQACTWACQAEASTDLIRRWEVTALTLTPYPPPPAGQRAERAVTGDVLDALTRSAQLTHTLEDDAQTRRRLAPVATAVVDEIVAWGREGRSPASIRLDASLAREIEVTFKLYHCESVSGRLAWVDSGISWSADLHQPAGDYLGVLRGPTAGESDFAARAHREVESLLLLLVDNVRLKL